LGEGLKVKTVMFLAFVGDMVEGIENNEVVASFFTYVKK